MLKLSHHLVDMNHLFNFINNCTNYSVFNNNNIFNFLYVTMNLLDHTSKVKFLENMKLLIGLHFYDEFKFYIFRKAPSSDLLNLFS